MKVLFICNTYMQVINAIQIKLNIKKSVEADIILSDHSVGAERVVDALKNTDVFSHVNLAETKTYTYQQNKFSDVLDVVRGCVLFDNKYTKYLYSTDSAYDEIFYFNLDMMLYAAVDVSIKNGKKPRCIQFEEGIHSYSSIESQNITSSGRLHTIKRIRSFLKKYDVYEATREYYCYYPEFISKKEGKTGYKIPLLTRDDTETIAVLNKVFNYNLKESDFHFKYMFFGSSADVDGYHVNEDEIILKIAKKVGAENLLVKTHPRDNRSIYREKGLNVMENSRIPWEIIQLNHDFSNHVFITLSSGSVLTASAILDEEINTYYLYPVVKEKNEAFFYQNEKMLKNTLLILNKTGKCQSHHIIEHIDMFENSGA